LTASAYLLDTSPVRKRLEIVGNMQICPKYILKATAMYDIMGATRFFATEEASPTRYRALITSTPYTV
jgi:hypothetical protein